MSTKSKKFKIFYIKPIYNFFRNKNERVHKIGKYSKKYFTNSDILHYGLITVIYTFGRDLKWNPHIHAIVTLGAFNKNHKYLEKKYFHINSIVGQWKKLVINIVKNGNYENEKLKKKAYHIASQLYLKNTFYQIKTWDTFQVNPFYCFKCHVKTRIKEITCFSSIRYKEYSY